MMPPDQTPPLTPPEPDFGILHLFGQQAWHDDAFIIGDRRGLELLRDLINQALEAETGAAANEGCNLFQNDGEGFPLYVAVCEGEELRQLASAYHDETLYPDFNGTSPHQVILRREERARAAPPQTADHGEASQ